MSQQDAFKAATFSYSGLFAIFGALAQQTGFESVMELDANVFRQLGQVQGQMFRDQAGIDGDVDAQMAFGILRGVVDTLGIDYKVLEETPSRVAIEVGPCPIHEAAKAVGWEHDMIAASCNAGSMHFLDAAAKQLNPKLTWRLVKFRGDDCQGCVEELVLSD
ncbi:MAG: L-2-amino-thiazoline-4-carboxylic acid hydrolase [Anaerolineae bacterium]|nr:L-2-amino-thiazoline-4-carboxylic acid hydrolase [Anaerolineae bacterium]